MEYRIEAKGNELFEETLGGNGKKNIDPVTVRIEITMSKQHYKSIREKLINTILKTIKI